MPPKLTIKKIRKDSSYAGAVKVGITAAGVKKSPSRSARRQQGKEPDSGPLPGTWDAFNSSKYTADFVKKQSKDKTLEGVDCYKLWKRSKITGERKLWGYRAERNADHFFPGQIIRTMDALTQTWYDSPIDNPDTAVHRDGPVYAKKRPMVVLFKGKRDLLCLPIRSLSNINAEFKADPGMWQEFISLTPVNDTSWKGNTPWAGDPLKYIATDPKKVAVLKRCYIQLVRPISIQMQSEMQMGMGRLSGGDYCRLVEAYAFSQSELKQAAFQEYGEPGKFLDGNHWWEGQYSGVWKSRELRMNGKQPAVVDKATTTYKLK